jgi:hypothetical protein
MIHYQVSVNDDQLRKFGRRLAGVNKAVEQTGPHIARFAKQSILLKPTKHKMRLKYGTRITRGKTVTVRRKIWSSVPGYAPNNDTGKLASSIGSRVPQKGVAEAYVTAKYATPLEFGWKMRKGGMVGARPFMRPAVDKAFAELTKKLQQRLNKP